MTGWLRNADPSSLASEARAEPPRGRRRRSSGMPVTPRTDPAPSEAEWGPLPCSETALGRTRALSVSSAQLERHVAVDRDRARTLLQLRPSRGFRAALMSVPRRDGITAPRTAHNFL